MTLEHFRSNSVNLPSYPFSWYRSRESGVGSWESGVGNRESGVGSRESGKNAVYLIRLETASPISVTENSRHYLGSD
ncbi:MULTISPECIES: hypothetical protein [Moorena]|uniref:hypothetical protein n=1 Tax=Moorena TaxID=1155738 RepID=UPI000301C3B4|nr:MULTISPECIES: hypothetical protein [Moorena]NEP35274.1 hypothetical protein [Moorena sp. SIO3B2]NEP70169.1 hypothetical protein [Moorena sp. SIO3A5]NEQ08823.1 hypothetical protein [Moorena sp. SIO4E2]NER87000.1 hypothetical protein [Moorena sp. SIO3A2]NES44246.1 hypothetical protein [Moorena sp. SIO2C4]